MNVAMFAAPPEPASPRTDPLDYLADVLFHEMGSPGVYGRTALYEDVVERLAALITRHREVDAEGPAVWPEERVSLVVDPVFLTVARWVAPEKDFQSSCHPTLRL